VSGASLLVLAAALAAAAPPAAGAATRTYSSGPLTTAIPDGGAVEHALTVPDRGPVSRVAVSVRLDHGRDADVTLTLRGPAGTTVVLAAGRGGAGRNFGTGRGCGGRHAEFADGADASVDRGAAPFVDGPYRPEQALTSFRRRQARGGWTLSVADSAAGATGTLLCWRLTVSREVVETVRTRRGSVTAELSFRTDPDGAVRSPRALIVRAGRTRLDRPLARLGCGGCPTWRPVGRPVVRDLDRDGEPEVLFDFYSGGAHCCTYSLIHRWDGRSRRYARTVRWWGNVGYRLADLDRDGRPELQSYDDRFSYRFTAYVASLRPLQVWHYEGGRLQDVTRRFPRLVARDAASLWRLYLRERRARVKEVRGILAAWLADQYLLGRSAAGWRRLEEAYRRGDVGRGRTMFGYPAGRRYLAELRSFLRRAGYAS
jgi:subtilisin-like proprotein convertase family protein